MVFVNENIGGSKEIFAAKSHGGNDIDRSLKFVEILALSGFKRPVNTPISETLHTHGEFSLDFTLNFWYDEMGRLGVYLAL